MDRPASTVELFEQVLVEIAQWLARTTQYSADHPSCAGLAEKALRTLTRALEVEPVLGYGILKDAVMIGEVASKHPVLRQRVAPHLHDRGVLVLRFLRGVTQADLKGFLDHLRLPPSTIFDRGGLGRLMREGGFTTVQLEELTHEISAEELEATRRRRRLGAFFASAMQNLRARRELEAAPGLDIIELLAHPLVAIALLEEQGAGIADAAAGMALLVRQEEERTGQPLAPKLRAIFIQLAPAARDRMLLGFPHLVDEFRAALAWAMNGFVEDELARFTLPSFRSHAGELDLTLYALGALLPHDGTRLSTLRRVGLLLHDLPEDDALTTEVLTALARPVDSIESYRKERGCLVEPAQRALANHALSTRAAGAPDGARQPPPFDDRALIGEVVAMASNTKQFERLCKRLPVVAARFAADGRRAALVGLVRALGAVERPEWHELALSTAAAVAKGSAAELLIELEESFERAGSAGVDDLVETARALVAQAPRAVLDHLERCQQERLRNLLTDLLPSAGPALLPLIRAKLSVDAGPSLLGVLPLLAGVGGKASDLGALVRSREPRVRLAVAQLLRRLPQDEQAMDIVVRYLSDPVPEVRQQVKMLVRGELLSAAAISALGALLSDEQQSDELLRRLIRALGMSRHDAAARLLWELVQPRGLLESKAATERRELAAASLRSCRAPAAAQLFDEGLHSRVWRVRKACERCLEDAT